MILIIGSEGFIGSHLMDFYSNSKVIGCHTNPKNVKKNCIYVNREKPDFDSVFRNNKFSICINASGSKGVGFSIENPEADYILNVENTNKILQAIKTYAPNCKFINLSSAAVYGNPKKLPIQESDQTNPISPYGKHKLLAESLTTKFHNEHKLPTCSLRIFSVYGPGLKKQLLWDVYNKIINSPDNSISLYGTGLESRDYIFIDDLVNAIDLITKKGNFEGSVYNVANGIEIKIEEITKLLVSKLKSDIQINFTGEVKEGNPLNWLSNIDKLKALGYKNKTSISEGINQYVLWLKKE